jgi:FAD/FMN-containing dehydrogenase
VRQNRVVPPDTPDTAAAARHDLARIVGDGAVTIPVADRSLLHDSTETRGLIGDALGAVFPGSTDEVAEVVRWCARTGVPFVPRGGGTGYAGGAVPDAGSLVIALHRMTAVREAVPQAWRMTVEAGLTTRGLQRAAAGEGLWFAPNPGAAEQSQIGGNIATNAGGPRSLRHGTVRAFVSGVELVLATGEVLRAGGAARKNVESLDLVGLACGSEGTVGVITAAWLRLLPRPELILPMVALYPDRAAGLAALEAAMACGCVPTSLEFVDARAFAAAAATYPRPLPVTGAFAVLAEAGGPAAAARVERDMLVEALRPGAVSVDAPDSESEARALESWRDGVSLGVVAVRGGKVSEDFAVPFDRLGDALEMVERTAIEHSVEVACWGHAGDGNVHASVMVDRTDPLALARAEAAATAFFAIPVALSGALSGEHGIGRVKLAAAAGLAPELLRAQRAVKNALDPQGIANPDRKVPPSIL